MSTTTMQSRMENPALAVPGALEALHALANSAKDQGLPATTAQLVHLRASQINGCSACVEIHAAELQGSGQPDEVWEQAAKHYDEQALGALVIEIASINAWNRINATIHQVAMPFSG